MSEFTYRGWHLTLYQQSERLTHRARHRTRVEWGTIPCPRHASAAQWGAVP